MAGVGPDTTVILYGGNNNWFAAYAYWLLKYRGFENVKLLDGGRKKWQIDSLPLESESPEITSTEFSITGPGATRAPPLLRPCARSAGTGHSRRRPVARGVQRGEDRSGPPPTGAAIRGRSRAGGEEHPLGQGGQ